ncbi:unnamed protein product [Ceutorhynchus assimilis]|uniref:Cysteine and histidine-rich domain-containing protein 1 n=1 Tax=Ceutorhynchus assimilis TaxID=467358 RepID=A0A9N9MNB4_9CUCU|nr:unnamed protein product [Ceutorhynchus assimilis]
MASPETLQCFNRGCGQKFDPKNNKDDACRHHPGAPFFHDAYKGWSCCNKKCTDFTEFLNIQGCSVTKHSNIKPPEPEKPKVEEIPDVEIVEVKPIIVAPVLKRPSLDSPMSLMQPEIAPGLKSQIDSIENPQKDNKINSDEIAVGTNCKNGGCTISYQDPSSNDSLCLHHPGVPIFHEGLKYWTCCQRKTTDFNAFLNQEGCKEGKHVWKKYSDSDTKVDCRWDYHQTGPYMVISVYAKNYSPSKSTIKLNPIRLTINLIFPQQNSATFQLDIELKGVVDVSACKVTMYGTKVEIKLKKAEAGNWSKLEERIIKNEPEVSKKEIVKPEIVMPKIEAVDLDDLLDCVKMQLTSSMRKILLYRGTFTKLSKQLTQKNIMTTPRKMQEVLDDLKGNPYYDKYAQKIAQIQQTAPEEFKSKIVDLEKKKVKKIEPIKGQQFSPLLNPKEKLATPIQSNEASLDKILKIELIKDKPAEEVELIWQKYHLEKQCISAIIPAKDFETLEQRSAKHPTFLFPLPRSQGYEFIMCQFEANTVHFTPLLHFQVHKENAPECLTITHYKEFKDDKGIVLMRGEYDKNVLNAKEAQCLANELQLYYVQTDKRKLEILQTFTSKPDSFDHMDLVNELNNLKLG